MFPSVIPVSFNCIVPTPSTSGELGEQTLQALHSFDVKAGSQRENHLRKTTVLIAPHDSSEGSFIDLEPTSEFCTLKYLAGETGSEMKSSLTFIGQCVTH